MLVCVSPLPCSLTCDPAVKFVPVRVTFTDVPRAPLEGVMDVNVGAPLVPLTVNGTELLAPAAVETETL
jgi:hypothetical protein